MKKLLMVIVIIGLTVFMAASAKSIKPEQRKKWQKMRAAHMMDTMDLRMKLAAKRVELRTLLKVQLLKMRNQHLLQCRRKFGGQAWNCPGGW